MRASENEFGDDGAARIAGGLLKSSSIKVCHLSNCKIAAKSAVMLAEVIRKDKAPMKDLDISNNLIIMDDIEILANSFKESFMDVLNIRGNIVSAEEIVAFEALLATVSTMSKRKFVF